MSTFKATGNWRRKTKPIPGTSIKEIIQCNRISVIFFQSFYLILIETADCNADRPEIASCVMEPDFPERWMFHFATDTRMHTHTHTYTTPPAWNTGG